MNDLRKWTVNGSEYRIRSTAEAHENDRSGIGTSLMEYNSEYGWIKVDPREYAEILLQRLGTVLDEHEAESE